MGSHGLHNGHQANNRAVMIKAIKMTEHSGDFGRKTGHPA